MRAMKRAHPLVLLLAIGCAEGESAPAGSSEPVRLHYYTIGPH